MLFKTNNSSFSSNQMSLEFFKQVSCSKIFVTRVHKSNSFLLENIQNISSAAYIIISISNLRINYPQLYLFLLNQTKISSYNTQEVKHIFATTDTTIFSENISLISKYQILQILNGKNIISLFLSMNKSIGFTNLLINY